MGFVFAEWKLWKPVRLQAKHCTIQTGGMSWLQGISDTLRIIQMPGCSRRNIPHFDLTEHIGSHLVAVSFATFTRRGWPCLGAARDDGSDESKPERGWHICFRHSQTLPRRIKKKERSSCLGEKNDYSTDALSIWCPGLWEQTICLVSTSHTLAPPSL